MSGSFWRTSSHREWTRAKDKVPMREVEDRNGRGYGTRSLWSLTALLKSSPGHTGRASWGQPSKEWTGKKTEYTVATLSSECLLDANIKQCQLKKVGGIAHSQGPLKKKSNRQIHLLPSQGGKFFFFFWVNEVTDISCFANLSCFEPKFKYVIWKTMWWSTGNRRQRTSVKVLLLPLLVVCHSGWVTYSHSRNSNAHPNHTAVRMK